MRGVSRINVGAEFHLKTLESVWLQGKLKMWGRWSVIDTCPEAPDMFKKLLKKYVVTRNDLSNVLRKIQRMGCATESLTGWIKNMLEESRHSSLVFCTDDEALRMDRVIATVFINHQPLRRIIERHYRDRVSQRELAEEMNENHPELSYSTCRRRISKWLSVAEYMLYQPMNDAFELNSQRFSLKVEPETD
ncbi:DUF1133 family protein [Pantoea agglomerans]|uniref:DUF1133 family protein n=1 Tax=Enterobacter agglomerans TaxID=549 RepID=UPI001302B8AF|nr:DUF1133 family protein [Pantoea agglomerans]QGY58496.1 DUF1133 family protein [Pantoea agglomerans]WNK43049.1 DUF1133 family protein [Pantoea agglomerans]